MATIKDKPAETAEPTQNGSALDTRNVAQRLLAVQAEVVGPRGQRGKFGASRSAESILAEVKPIAVKHGLLITSTDRTEVVEERRYLVSQVTAVNVADPADCWQVEGRAWEGEPELTRDGRPINDTPQVTGKASSYATKFALQHLLAIGGEGDPDVDHADAPARAATGAAADAATDVPPAGWESWDSVNLNHKAIQQRIKKLPDEIDRAPFKNHVDACGGFPLAKEPFEFLIGLVDRAEAKHRAMHMTKDGVPADDGAGGAIPEDAEARWNYLVESAETAQVDASGLKALIEYTTGDPALAGPQMSQEQVGDVLSELDRVVSGELSWGGETWVDVEPEGEGYQ